MSDYTLDLGNLGKFDFDKASKLTIVKGKDSVDTVIAEFKPSIAKVNNIDGDLIIKIGSKSYKVAEIEGDGECQQKVE